MALLADRSTLVSTGARAMLQRDWLYFTLLTFLFGFGFSVYGGVFQNFLRDQLHAGPMQMGGLESLREIPGLMAALTAGSLVALAEAHVAGLGLLVTALGVAATGLVGNYFALVLVTAAWSAGFHLWATVSPAITLNLARGKDGGRHLGRMSAWGSAATLAGLGFAWVFSRTEAHAGYKPYFFIAGGCILLSALLCMKLSPHAAGAPRARLILRRKYGLYYLLIFLEGCRRQIFSIFASYALILVYGMPLPMMLTLQWVNAVLITITAPLMGRMTDRYGERWTLMFYAIGLILVFTGYATSHNVITLGSLFLIDNILFTFGVGFTTYLHRIAPPEDLTPCLAMGTTMNHIAAVAVPISGAWLWGHCHNYQAPFWVGVAVAVMALVATRWIPTSHRRAL